MDDLFYIDGYYLDKYQIECVKCNKNLLVIAGAGCGKTSTILGKVKYLISLGYKESDILCISLTNEATDGLKNKLLNISLNIDCYTFHKLSLNIIRKFYKEINICSDNYLDYIVDEYFLSVVKYSYRKYIIMAKFKNTKYDKIINSREFDIYKKELITFINLFKNKGYNLDDLFYFYKSSFIKHDYFLLLEIYCIYLRELESRYSFDFNDMISYANKLINEYKVKLKYKYIIIDEFQDTSKIRIELIKSIIKYNGSRIMCVGDDYQSIYRFAGSDIELFLNFKDNFNNSEIMYLKNTYRNSMELLSISSGFICKNKYQIRKELFSNKHNNKPIKILKSANVKKDLKYLLSLVGDNYMVLGRNNFDIKEYVDKYEVMNINYMTVHKSKGLESDNIILINLTDNLYGFPSKKKNSKLINKLFDKELYKFDEERRLFYVAITRTKNNVYILEEKNSSCFLKELKKDYSKYIEYIN